MPLRYLLLLLLIICPATSHAQADDTDEQYTILILGDSLTAGYGLAAEDAFPARLEQALQRKGYAVRVVNAGISGDTSAGGLRRLPWALADRPDLVVVALGANDALRGLDPEITARNLGAIIEKLLAEDIRVMLAGMQAPRNLGADYYNRFDRIYPDLAEKYSVPLYPFFLAGVATEPELNQPDGIHPNPAGVRVMVDNILPHLEAVLPAAVTAQRSTR